MADLIEADRDNFNGAIVRAKHYGASISTEDFHKRLAVSLTTWKAAGKRGVWLTIPLSQSELIPVAAKLGFEFHHSKPDQVTMTRWLPENEASTLPINATHNIGVAGFVVNEKKEVLVIQEKWLRKMKFIHWKFPGGVCDPGEDLWQTAVRETFEETGIRTEFVSVLSFRHMHGYQWGIDDMYVSCLLRPLNTDFNIDTKEIAEAKWMDIDEFIKYKYTTPTDRQIAESYQDGVKRGFMIQPTVYPHFIPHKPDLSLYRIRSCDPTRPCDLTRNEWFWNIKGQDSDSEATKSNISSNI